MSSTVSLPSEMIPTPLAMALAVIGWSPVTMMTLNRKLDNMHQFTKIINMYLPKETIAPNQDSMTPDHIILHISHLLTET